MKPFMKKLLSTLSISLVCLVFVACDSTKPVTKNTASDTLEWETLMSETYNGPEEAKFIIAQEPSVVTEFYAEINTNRAPDIAVPDVDYTKEQLLLLCMGQKNTGGFAIEVANIAVENSEVVVTVKETTPTPGAMVTMALTSPFTVVKMPHTDKKIVFKKL